ncbi:MAG TPA: PilN domain-containing protein [Candidatus Binatia bacterium]
MNLSNSIRNLPRADFLRSVGIYIMRDHLVLVRLRKNFLNVTLLEQELRDLPIGENRQAISELTGWIAEDVREIALKAEYDSRERALRQAILSLLPHFSAGRDSLYICVPQDQAIIQTVYLPQAAEANLQQVLEYEIERQIPFNRDEIYYDYLPIGKRGDKIGVHLFAVPKKHLAGVLDVLGSFGIVPSGVETTGTALANYLLFCKKDFTGCAAIVGGHADERELIGVRAGAAGWTQAPELLFSHRLPEAEWAKGIGKELITECLRQTPELYGWGNPDQVVGSVDGEKAQCEDLCALGIEKLGGSSQLTATTLPAVGAALRGVREARLETNFLRPPGAERGARKNLSLLNSVMIGLLILLLVGWGISYPIKDELRLKQLQQENHKNEPYVEALRREEVQLQTVRKEVQFLSDIDRRKGEVLRVLDELSKVVPTSAYLSNFRYRNGVLEVQGNAENASTLIPLLEKSPLFENVAFNAPSNRGRDNRETFSLKADLEKQATSGPKLPPSEKSKEKAGKL